MAICNNCEEQGKKTRNGKPHELLTKDGTARIFKGINPRGFEEQDYHCLACQAKFTHSTDKSDRPWTLWQG